MSHHCQYRLLIATTILLTIISILIFIGKLPMFLISSQEGTVNNHFNNASKVKLSLNISLQRDDPDITISDDDDDDDASSSNDHLQVVWLMSFPNSGTTYTNHLIQDYTKTTTGTNYGQEQSTNETTVPIFSHSINGPYFRYLDKSVPPKFVLTKTHCGGECDTCQSPKSQYYISTTDKFENACCTGKRIVHNRNDNIVEKIPAQYSPTLVKRAVHLIRNPFDNIVSRLHLKERRWKRLAHKVPNKYNDRLDIYNETKDGFRAYCHSRDAKNMKTEMQYHILNYELLSYAIKIPCHTEFMRYVKWHNYAIDVIQKQNLPVLTLFYEEYGTNWNQTVQLLLDFLELSPAIDGTATPFIPGKHYIEFYDYDEIEAAKQFMLGLASSELKRLLLRYFK